MTEEEVEIIPVVEERLVTSKVKVETGRVRVRTLVNERQEVVRDRLMRDRVAVERVAINREIEIIPEPREEDGVTIIPVIEEVLVVSKKLMLVEEIHLSRQTTTEEFEQPVTVRVQRGVVERAENSGEAITRMDEETIE